VTYLLLADDKTYRCRNWDDLTERLVWAHRQGFTSAKARRTAWEEDRPLLPSEAVALVEAATDLAAAFHRENGKHAGASRPADEPVTPA
jgi:hypothetical protein